MYDLDYVDESVIDACKRSFNRVYPEFHAFPLGVAQNKQELIFECEFPDGVFWFRVNERSVSSAYKSKEDADRE